MKKYYWQWLMRWLGVKALPILARALKRLAKFLLKSLKELVEWLIRQLR